MLARLFWLAKRLLNRLKQGVSTCLFQNKFLLERGPSNHLGLEFGRVERVRAGNTETNDASDASIMFMELETTLDVVCARSFDSCAERSI